MTTPSNHSTLWLLSRVDQHCREAVEDLLNKVTEKISTATGDAVSIRMRSGDGQSLIPVAAHHPDLYRAAAMAAVMGETVQPVTSGLWQTVVNTRRPARWHVPPGSPAPVEASPAQVEFFRGSPLGRCWRLRCCSMTDWLAGLVLSGSGPTSPSPTTTSPCSARVRGA